jgi:peptide/nickel transport system substrate-binding protein
MAGYIIGPAGIKTPSSLLHSTDGAGPYELEPSATIAGSEYTFIPNPYFYDPAAVHYAKVIIHVIPVMSSDLAALRTGTIDFFVSDGPTTRAAAADGYTVIKASASFEGLYIFDSYGVVSKPLGSLQVRQAMNYAVDRPALAKAIYGNLAVPDDQIQEPGEPSYVASLANYYPYDVAKAKKLMAAAGYPNGFTVNVASLAGEYAELDEAIAGELSAIKITLNIKVFPQAPQCIEAMLSKKYPMALLWYGGLPLYIEAGQLLESGAGFLNPFNNTDPAMTKLINAGAVATGAAQAADWAKLEALTITKAWFLVVLASDNTYVTNGKVGGVTTGPADAFPDPGTFYPIS